MSIPFTGVPSSVRLDVRPEITEETRISGRCAIGRNRVSAPLRELIAQDLMRQTPHVPLHLGSGRAHLDTEALGFEAAAYDPNHEPSDPSVLIPEGYDFIYCQYVANVLPTRERGDLYRQIRGLLAPGGAAYIVVRADRVRGVPEQDGVRTSTGTFQKSYGGISLIAELNEYFVDANLILRRLGFLVAKVGK